MITRLLLLVVCVAMAAAQPGLAQKGKKPAKKSTTSAKAKPAAASTQDVQARPGNDRPNLDNQPSPLEATAFTFPHYEEFTLPNGLHVFVVENHEQPILTVNLAMRGGDAYDPASKEGVAAVMGSLLSKGTKSRSAAQIATALDGVGASLGLQSAGESMTMSGSALKKHANLLLSILSEELREPTFPEEELEKLRQQMIANIAYERSKPLEVAQALARKVVYGSENPLARKQSEESVKNITRADVVAFHSNFVRPNNASIAFVGDVSVKEVRDWLSKHFGAWEKGAVPTVNMPDIKPLPAGVYFIPRKGSVQSSVILSAPAPAVRDPRFDALNVTCSYIGSGFGSLFFNTLRETYSYTYSPFGFVSRGRRYNRIALGAEVRTSVTDSAIIVMMREIRRLVSEGPDHEALQRRVTFEAGQYRMSLESAGTVAALLQNAWLNEVPLSTVSNYAERLENVSVADVQNAASRYLNMLDLRVVVVGDPSVREKLEQFGQISDYTVDVVPARQGAAMEAVSISVDELVGKYTEAIGGERVKAVQSLTVKSESEMMMQGNKMSGVILRTLKTPGKEYSKIDMKVMTQEQWVDGKNAWIALMNGPAAKADDAEVRQLLLDAYIFPVLEWKNLKYKVTVVGKQDGQIVVEATAPTDRAEKYFFDASTFLLSRVEKDMPTEQGPITIVERYENYESIDGVKFPAVTKISNPVYSITMKNVYGVNVPIDDAAFVPSTGK